MATGRLGSLRRAAALSLRAMSASEASTSGRAAAAADAWDRPYSSWGAGPSPVRAQRGAWQGQQQLGVRMFSSLEALAEPHQATYHIEVVTGDVRGAGSAAPASITLYGDAGESDSHVIGAEETASGFERATHKSYVIYAKDLGALKRVHIQQLAPTQAQQESGEGSSAWYLDKVVVRSSDGDAWTFPCGAWLGRASGPELGVGGCEERNLIPADDVRDVHRSSLHDPLRRITRPLQVDAAGFAIPHPEKVAAGVKGANRKGFGTGGEDSYFYASNRNGIFALGVADGVYMWREQGIDAGAFARQLMEYCRQAVELGTTDVLRVLQFAQRHLARAGVQGSCTACVLLVDTLQGRLAAANVGDSGFALLGYKRDGRGLGGEKCSSGRGKLAVRYRSPQQEHSFGHPYQLGHHAAADAPEDAMLSTMPVYPGDVIVMGSDGLWDNLSEEEVVETVERVLLEGLPPSAVSQALAAQAFEASVDRKRDTPYSRGASSAFDMIYSGGKQDDISILTAVLA